MYFLESRWKQDGRKLIYFGLRNKKNLHKNIIKLSSKQTNIINELPKALSKQEIKDLKKLYNFVVVSENKLRKIPTSLDEAKFCTECIANDYIIPGIEFDDNGLCPMCQTKDLASKLKSVVPIMNVVPKSKNSKFDVGLFYTGGKDSTYLLYYLSVTLNLKVLAMTWEIPFMSDSARLSIENAKKKLKNVEFVSKKIDDEDLKKIYSKLYSLNENTCACPSLAYVLFYPDLVTNQIPYFVVGNEPVQMLGLYYNNMAPRIAYSFSDNKFLHFLINVGRIIAFKPPLKRGQFQSLVTMKQLAYGDNFIKKMSGYKNELVTNVTKSIMEVEGVLEPLRRSIKESSRSGKIPSFIHIDLNDISGGLYDWNNIKDLIVEECGWVAPVEGKGLHTSCKIEKCKEHSQFQRFYNMKSTMIPFSALEIALASRKKNISRAEAIFELKQHLGFTLNEVEECRIMKDYFME